MCSDEMTTGSVMATAADRGILARRSHAFNISQPKFKRLFPDYSKLEQINLPNMGETKKSEESTTSGQSLPTSATPSAGDQKADDKGKEIVGGSAGKVIYCSRSLQILCHLLTIFSLILGRNEG
jgi:hypothetical protein